MMTDRASVTPVSQVSLFVCWFSVKPVALTSTFSPPALFRLHDSELFDRHLSFWGNLRVFSWGWFLSCVPRFPATYTFLSPVAAMGASPHDGHRAEKGDEPPDPCTLGKEGAFHFLPLWTQPGLQQVHSCWGISKNYISAQEGMDLLYPSNH